MKKTRNTPAKPGRTGRTTTPSGRTGASEGAGRDRQARPGRPGFAAGRDESRRDDSRRDDSRRDESQTRSPGRPARAPSPRRAEGRTEPREADQGPQVNKHNLLYGLHPVAAAWINPDRRCRTLFVTEAGKAALAPAIARADEERLDRPTPRLMEKEALDRLLPPGAVHQGVALDCAPLPEVGIEDITIRAESDPQALVIVLDQVTDPHNVGAIMRSAAAFGALAVVVQDRHAPPVTGVLAKTASGAVDAVPLVRVTNLARALTDLQQAGFWCVGLDEAGAKPLHEHDLTGRTALVMGSEGEGLRRLTAERCDEIAHLPTRPPIGSLNVSNAAAVALYEVARRR